MKGRLSYRVVGLSSLTLLLLSGCAGLKVQRAYQRGDYQLAVGLAASTSRELSGNSARALAASYVELGETERARGLLQRDFRHGGNLDSLVALADLEWKLGYRGSAVSHWSRVVSLDAYQLAGRVEICEAFKKRANVYLQRGEGVAGVEDLRRARTLCPDAWGERESNLDAQLRALAKIEVEGQRALEPCDGCISPVQASRLSSELESARIGGPRTLREFADSHRLELPVSQIVYLLASDYLGHLGETLLSNRELELWLGSKTIADFELALGMMPSGQREYVMFRLENIAEHPGGAENDDTKRRENESRITRIMSDPSISGQSAVWRLLAVADNDGVRSVERWIVQYLRAQLPKVSDAQGQPAESQPLGIPWAWLYRVPITPKTSGHLVRLAKVRYAQGERAESLRLSVHLVGSPELDIQQVARLAFEYLRAGEPYTALALVRARGESGRGIENGTELGAVRAAALRMLELGRLVEDDLFSEDAQLVRQLNGDEWLSELNTKIGQEAFVLDWQESEFSTCADWSLASIFEPTDGSDALAVLRSARQTSNLKGFGEPLREAIEKEWSPGCVGQYLVPLLWWGAHRLSAETLGSRNSIVPDNVSAVDLEYQAHLALSLGETDRASQLVHDAIGRSTNPKGVWLRAARRSQLYGQLEFERESYRQALLLTESSPDETILLALLASELDDFVAGNRRLHIQRVSVVEHIHNFVSGGPTQRRWGRERRLVETIADRWGPVEELGADTLQLLADGGVTMPIATRNKLGKVVGAKREKSAATGTALGVFAPAPLPDGAQRWQKISKTQNERQKLKGWVTMAFVGDNAYRALAVEQIMAIDGLGFERREEIAAGLARGWVGVHASDLHPVRIIEDQDVLFRLTFTLDLDLLWLRAKTWTWGNPMPKRITPTPTTRLHQ